jgi:amidase
LSKIKRREFLRYGVVGGTAALAGSLALGVTASAPRRTAITRRRFELEEATIADLQAAMERGERSARSITEAYLDRIEALDKRGPAINSVIEVNPDALGIARRLDDERGAGHVRGPLHGIPIVIKDNIDTADRMQTTAGSLALVGRAPRSDAFLVGRLREAGAVILGKTNLSEWANFRSTRSSSGWSGRGGQTRNPYALDRNPCGSSSGSGAAVAASLCAAAIGTETDGSIVCPSSANSVVGIKPTVGLVSRSGIVPISHSQDTAGPMARTVADAAALLGVMAGVDPGDAATQSGQEGENAGSAKAGRPADYTQFLDPRGLEGARIGVARNLFMSDERVRALVEDALAVMTYQGATVVDPTDFPQPGDLDQPEFDILLYEFKADLNAYLQVRGVPSPAGSLAELIKYNEANRDTEMPYFGQEIFEMAEAKGPLTTPEYLDAVSKVKRLARDEGIDALLREHRLDAMIAPTAGPPCLTDLVAGDHYTGGSSSPAAVAGYPNITLPLGYVFGLPVGISFFGGRFSEPGLLRIAYAFEQVTKVRRAPGFLATADLAVDPRAGSGRR